MKNLRFLEHSFQVASLGQSLKTVFEVISSETKKVNGEIQVKTLQRLLSPELIMKWKTNTPVSANFIHTYYLLRTTRHNKAIKGKETCRS